MFNRIVAGLALAVMLVAFLPLIPLYCLKAGTLRAVAYLQGRTI